MSFIEDIIERDADPRVKNWYWMSNPLPTIIASIIYVILVKKILPQFMKNRKPFQLKNLIIFYNAVQVVLSVYIFYILSNYGWLRFNSLFCEPIDLKQTELLNGSWWYYFSKFTEFFDTIFFVLRKKNNQVSKLHVVHHSVMPTISWIGLKYAPGGTGTVFGAINSFVHIIMYSYYLLTAMGPKYQKYLWWKRYLTVLQLVQFTFIIIYSVLLTITDCKINKIFSNAILIFVTIIFIMFSNFYKKTYADKPKKMEKAYKNDNEKPGPSFISSSQYESKMNLQPKRS